MAPSLPRPTATVNVGPMTAGAPCTAVPGDPHPAPDAFSAGTRRVGRGRSRKTAPPHHSAVSSVAAFSRSHLAVPITEPVTRFVTGTLCHVLIPGESGETRGGDGALVSGDVAVGAGLRETGACRLITQRSTDHGSDIGVTG